MNDHTPQPSALDHDDVTACLRAALPHMNELPVSAYAGPNARLYEGLTPADWTGAGPIRHALCPGYHDGDTCIAGLPTTYN